MNTELIPKNGQETENNETKVEETKLKLDAERKKKRLDILERILYGAGGTFILFSGLILFYPSLFCREIPSEMSISMSFLGSVITTIIGVMVGSSLEK